MNRFVVVAFKAVAYSIIFVIVWKMKLVNNLLLR